MLKRSQTNSKGFCYLIISLLLLSSASLQANDLSSHNIPAISIIIDDMGYRLNAGRRAINLSGDFTYSFLPHAPHALELSKTARLYNKEIMLHLPMEAESGYNLGPGGLTQCMSEKIFVKTLEKNIKLIPYAKGFNNHMGSLLTKSPLIMTRLMREMVNENYLFFVDSRTTSESVALNVAKAEGLKSITRDIFIDHEETNSFINMQLKKLIKRAKRKGTALAIAHPKKITLAILEKWIPKLKAQGIRLVPVSTLIELQREKLLVLNAHN